MYDNTEKLKLPGFLVLLFVVSWLGAVPMVLNSYKVRLPGPLSLLQILMLFGPGIAACAASWVNEGKAGIARLLKGMLKWKKSPLYYIGAIAGPPVVFFAALMAGNTLGWTHLPFPPAGRFLAGFGSVFGVYAVLNTEELAWRGYVLPRLQRDRSPLMATFFIAILWTVFHLPLFLMKGGHPAGYPFWLFTLMIFGISLPFTFLYNSTGGSILLPHLLHQSFNAAAEALPVFPAAAGSIAPIAISVAFFFFVSALMVKWARRFAAERIEYSR